MKSAIKKLKKGEVLNLKEKAWLIDQAEKAERLENAIKDINDAVAFYGERGRKVISETDRFKGGRTNYES